MAYNGDPLFDARNTQPARADALPELKALQRYGLTYTKEGGRQMWEIGEHKDGKFLYEDDVAALLAAWNRRPASAPDAELINRIAQGMIIFGWAEGGSEDEFIDDLGCMFDVATEEARKHSTAAEEGHG